MIKSKLEESLKSILPIALIVFALSVTLTPIDAGYMFIFLVGIAFLVFGMALFNIGAEMSMQPLGVKIGLDNSLCKLYNRNRGYHIRARPSDTCNAGVGR